MTPPDETTSDPLLSIITVSYNSLPGLIATNRSLPENTDISVQSIVIDSLSTDGTAKFLESSECRYLVVVREKDEGIYDAMNKGIRLATGKYLLFMNCGDRVAAELPWEKLRKQLESEEAIHIGNLRTDDGGEPRISGACFSYDFLSSSSLPHQAALIPAEYFRSVGVYDKTYRISADQEWFLRAMKQRLPFRELGFVVAEYAGGGTSERPENVATLLSERRHMLGAHLSKRQLVGLKIRKRSSSLRAWLFSIVRRIVKS